MISYDENNVVKEIAFAPALIDERWTGPWYRRVQSYVKYWTARWGL